MYNNLRQNYLESEVLTAGPVRLVELLYRGAIEAIAQARDALLRGDVRERSHQITKAVAIVNELAMSLDHSKSEKIARPLVELYDYMARRLLAANIQQIDEPLSEVRELLATLLEAWQVSAGDPANGPFKTAMPSAATMPGYEPLTCSL